MVCTKASLVEFIEATSFLSDNEKTDLIWLAGEQPSLWEGCSEKRALQVLAKTMQKENAKTGTHR